MKILSKIKSFTNKTVLICVMVAAAMAGGAFYSSAQAACSANSVINCGVSSISSLQQDYNTNSSIRHIYNDSFFGISSNDINSMGQYAVSGNVSSDGTVTVSGNKVVATNAWTAGRENMSNSCGVSTKRSNGGTTFWTRKPCVSFTSNSQSAYVVMKNGVFQFAILTSCGNPVKGTPKKPTPTPHHNACVQNACKQVSGAGKNTCTTNANCKPKPTPTPTPHHSVCVENACVSVPGAGYNTCSSNVNCQHHYACVNLACTRVAGPGVSTCSSNANCSHYACENNACVPVAGAGSNTCTSNANCQPAPTICTPTPQPPSQY